MGTYRFGTVGLVWCDAQQNIDPADPADTSFPLQEFREHCGNHLANRCDLAPGQHSPLNATNHTFDLPAASDPRRAAVVAASVRLFGGFQQSGNFTLNPLERYHSSAAGGQWIENASAIAHQLLENGNAIQRVGAPNSTLFLEMVSTVAMVAEKGPYPVAQMEGAGMLGSTVPIVLVVQLSRTRGHVLGVEAVVMGQDGSNVRSLQLSPAAKDSRTLIAAVSQITGEDILLVRITYVGEPPTVVADPAIRARGRIRPTTALEDYAARAAEIASATQHQDVMRFFLEFDVQFRVDMRELWRPLTPGDSALDLIGDETWMDRREAMLERQINNAANLVVARVHAQSEAEHDQALRTFAQSYGEPDVWDDSMYVAHVAELAKGQETVFARHFAGGAGLGQVRAGDLEHAFTLFVRGELRTSLPAFPFRNGEPDSSFMFFWAEFANEVVRCLGPGAADGLDPEQLWFWTELRDRLVEAGEEYRRHYQPDGGGVVAWEDYGANSFRALPHPAVPGLGGRMSGFAEWRSMLRRSFGLP